MEFEEFVEKRKRMCKEYIPCSNGCPIYSARLLDIYHAGCAQWCLDNFKSAEEIVDDWTKDNPVLTNAAKFKEVFGVDIEYSSDHPGYLYINKIIQKSSLDHAEDMRKWLESEYIAPEEKQNV